MLQKHTKFALCLPYKVVFIFSEWRIRYCWMSTLSRRAACGILPRIVYL